MKSDQADYSSFKILIVGPLTLQNEFLCYVIQKELETTCSIYDRELNSFSGYPKIESGTDLTKKLILIDTEDQSFEEILKTIATNASLSDCFLALFNLKEDAGVEKKALSRNICGFFYKDDQFEIFLKGIRTILKGEVWISRAVLLKCVYDSFKEKQVAIEEKTALTAREVEILSLVSMGSTNEEIAAKMFISTNTVKTHLYNIFKKINVGNRLQAALWAAANL